MTKWTKIKPKNTINGRAPRTTPGVARSRSGSRAAKVILPPNYVFGERADVYSDGNGKLAFSMGERGAYVVAKSNNSRLARTIIIPSGYAHLIPYGTMDCELTRDGDMWVLDTSTLGADQ